MAHHSCTAKLVQKILRRITRSLSRLDGLLLLLLVTYKRLKFKCPRLCNSTYIRMTYIISSITLYVAHTLLFSTQALQPSRLIVRFGLDVPTSATRRFHALPRESTRRRKVELWARNVRKFWLNADIHVTFRYLLHAIKLRHATDGFTSPPKEGVLRIFSP